jgi:plasmid stabilization system protein ParE
MASYHLTERADDDLSNIFRQGVIDFGLVQAERYFDGLVERLGDIASRRAFGRVDAAAEGRD